MAGHVNNLILNAKEGEEKLWNKRGGRVGRTLVVQSAPTVPVSYTHLDVYKRQHSTILFFKPSCQAISPKLENEIKT